MVESSKTTNRVGKITKKHSVELIGIKLSIGICMEANVKINSTPYKETGFIPPLPKYGSVAASTYVKPGFNPNKLPHR